MFKTNKKMMMMIRARKNMMNQKSFLLI